MGGKIQGWASARYMPKLLDYKDRLEEIPFDFHEMIGALAPRRCLISAPLGDGNFKWDSVDRIAQAASAVYRLHGVAERLRVEHPDCGYDFPDEVRQLAYRFLKDGLQGNRARTALLHPETRVGRKRTGQINQRNCRPSRDVTRRRLMSV